MFTGEIKRSIVDGIIEGYRDYLDVRRQKARELKVHGAYAWVKGNHIDHYVALSCREHGVSSTLAKAEIEDDLKSVLTQTIAAEGVLDASAFGIVLGDAEEQESRILEKRCLLVYW